MGLNAVVRNTMIEEAGFDEPLNNIMQPPTQSSTPTEFQFQNSVGNLELPLIPPPSSFQTVPPPPPVSTPTPLPIVSPPIRRSAPRKRRCLTSPSLAASPAASTPQRKRLRRTQTPFERATARFVDEENRRLQLEEDHERNRMQLEVEREKNLHEREMEHLRLESRRLDLKEQQMQATNRVESILTAILTQLSNRL